MQGCHIPRNCTICDTRWNVRTRIKLHGHVKLMFTIGESTFVTIED